MQATMYWNQVYTTNQTHLPKTEDPMLVDALAYFGNLQGKVLLDLGCGNGSSALFFARHGAEVIAVDTSKVAIASLSQFCQQHQIDNVHPVLASAFEIDNIVKIDCCFGNMILHHLEPFEQFSQVLRKAMKPNAKAFFRENNAMSQLLVWCRNHLVGRYGIPKFGDADEFPLTPAEVNHLRTQFQVEVEQPEMVFFQLASQYLLKGRLAEFTKDLDQLLYQVPMLRQYSYRQYLKLSGF